jgi:hypothetical protein
VVPRMSSQAGVNVMPMREIARRALLAPVRDGTRHS